MRWKRVAARTVVLSTLIAAASCEQFDQRGLPTESDLRAPLKSVVPASTSESYTTNEDFAKGTLVNVNYDETPNQLQLNKTSGTFPFIWVALSQRCTIGKINTATGEILGEYRTVADGVGCAESSRTTVGIDGSVWVGHRGSGGVAHIGLVELNQCVDRNGNGVIDTSTGYGDVKAWPGGSPSNVANAQDECILHHVGTDALGFGDTRHLSIDADNNLWIGSFVSRRFVRVDATTGSTGPVRTGFACGGYGGLIDQNGVIWSANGGGNGLLRWDPNAPDVAGENPRCIPIPNYGLAVDQDGWIWANEFGVNVRKVSPDGNTILGPFLNGAHLSSRISQGLAVDANGDVWISSGLFCNSNCTIGHLKNDGTFVGNVPNPNGAGSTGVSVDADGNIWSANRNSHTATRIDPNAGPIGADGVTRVGAVELVVNFPATAGRPLPFPYNYSDMTGAQLFGSTAPQGTWTVVQDGGEAGMEWGTISWNNEPQGFVPPGGSITVEAKAADTQAALGSQPYVTVSNGTSFDLTGRFIQVRVTLRAAPDGTSPVLSDITIQAETVGPTCSENVIAIAGIWSNSTEPGTVSLQDARVFVSVHSVEAYIPRPARASDLRLGASWTTGTPARNLNVTDLNGDGERDVLMQFRRADLVAAGNLSAATTEVTIWGTDRSTGDVYCGATAVNVMP